MNNQHLNIAELKNIFDSIDTNKDGVLELEELEASLKQAGLPLENAKQMMKEVGVDLGQGISYDQFILIIHKRQQLLNELFDSLDQNKDEQLDITEVQQGLKRLMNIQLTGEELTKLFNKLHPTTINTINHHDFERALIFLPATSQKELITMWVRTNTLSFFMHSDKPRQQSATVTLVAGLVAGAVSRTITAPFDRVSLCLRAGGTLHQNKGIVECIQSMVKTGGIKSLWRGNGVNCIQVGPESALTFFLYELLKNTLLKDPEHPSSVEKFSFGAVSGWAAMTLVYPMYVIQARMAIAEPGVYSGLLDCFRKTADGGIAGLFKGYYPSSLRIIPYKGSDLLIFNTLKEFFVKQGEAISVWQSMAFGALASAFSQTLTYPLVTARTKLQAQPMEGRPILYHGMWDALKKTVNGDTALGLRAEGMRGLYFGCTANLMKMVPAVAIQFTVYEKVLTVIKELTKDSN